MTVFLVSVSIALGVSFLCSILEAVLLSLTPTQVAEMSQKHPHIARIWKNFKSDISRPIAAILILNTASHTMGASFAGAQFNTVFNEKYLWIFSLVFTYLMLQFTEILPKSLAVRLNSQLAYFIARPLQVAVVALAPVIWVIHLINRPFERGAKQNGTASTLEEITALAGLARLSREINTHQERVILGVSRLSATEVTEVMIPLDEVSYFLSSQSLNEALSAALWDAHTRYPVVDADDGNHVLGFVNIKEVAYSLKLNPQGLSLQEIIRPVHHCKSTASAAELLRTFVDGHVHMSIVADETGKTLGMVTMEDLVEELVGDLEDEFDRLPKHFHPLMAGRWLVGGGATLTEMRRRIGGEFAGGARSVSDWLMDQLPEDFEIGSTVEADGYRFVVRRIRRGRIFEVSAEPQPAVSS